MLDAAATEKSVEKIRTFVSNAKEGGLYPPMFVTEGLSSEPRVVVEGREVVSFASANYLGLANDARVKKAVIDGIDRALREGGTQPPRQNIDPETMAFLEGAGRVVDCGDGTVLSREAYAEVRERVIAL